MERFVSLLGIATFIGLAWLMSSHKRHFPWRVVACGLVLQVLLAAFITLTPYGEALFSGVNFVFNKLIDSVDAGSSFVFGGDFTEHFIAFKILPTIIFFSALMSIFYYMGVIQWVVGVMAWVMQKTLGTSGAETLSAAANVFVGQTEAPLVIRPYISSMTTSELNAVMVGGFATMAGGVLGGLAGMGFNAGDLLAASVISAPGALMLAKIMQPELEEPKTRGSVKVEVKDESANVLEAIANGTIGGLQLALNVGAMLIVFLGLLAVMNLVLGGLGDAFWWSLEAAGRNTPENPAPWTIEGILGTLFQPVAWLIGIEAGDTARAGELLGLKMGTNEFVAYTRLDEWAAADSAVQISERTRYLMTFALCGFANFSSIGIQLGGIGGMAPERRGDLARLGLRAMIGGTLASFLTAAIASLLYSAPAAAEALGAAAN
ncbi:NupC/NupG family nucleoside CNT transporter [Aeoliella sp. SH292]|uniref:NupC/NupG family nucleoside CNT transporter n=1 Tax=Aeoliella sp. SH292 TaxID=3454464 RepID=UPI003F9C69B7